MNNHSRKIKRLAATAAALAGLATTGHAQSADALIDKLVDKGILTVKEAKDLREEADKDFARAHQVKTGIPDWVSTLKLGGDLRGRYDVLYNPDHAGGGVITDRHRFRYRLRFGVVAALKDNFEVGFRLTSGEPKGSASQGGDPISGNASFGDNGSKKFVYIDQAYAKWTALNTPDFTLVTTVGKMENPFVLSEMLFDPDYTPEGAAVNLTYSLSDSHALKFNGGGFVLDELGALPSDPFMGAAQVRWDAAWTPKLQSSVGGALLAIANARGGGGLTALNVADVNGGNSRSPVPVVPATTPATTTAGLDNAFTTMVLDASTTYSLESFPFYTGAFPIKVGAEYIENLAAANRKHGYGLGVTFGKSGKKGLWDVSYRWKEMQANSWYEEMVDSDFGAYYQTASKFAGTGYTAGVNLRGHVVRAQYTPYDAFTLAATVFLADVISTVGAGAIPANYDSQVTRIQVDAIWKF